MARNGAQAISLGSYKHVVTQSCDLLGCMAEPLNIYTSALAGTPRASFNQMIQVFFGGVEISLIGVFTLGAHCTSSIGPVGRLECDLHHSGRSSTSCSRCRSREPHWHFGRC
eukprot:2474070-Amphidinium_carterae.1